MQERAIIVVRGFEPDDVLEFSAIQNQRSVAEMTLQIPYTSLAEQRDRYSPTPTHRMLVATIDGRVVGGGGLSLHTRRRSHVGGIGMGVHEDFQGRGVGTALLTALLDLGDNWYNLRRIELEVYTDNEPAIRLYQRYGFEVEGTHRSYAFRGGRYVDAHSMARLRNDPPIIRDEPSASG